MAVLLAAVGIEGLLSYPVAQRAHEIGIRMALGAQQGDLLRLVIEQGMRLTLIGISVGVVGALSTSRLQLSVRNQGHRFHQPDLGLMSADCRRVLGQLGSSAPSGQAADSVKSSAPRGST